MCIGIGAQRVQKMSHDIRQLVNETTSQVRRAPSVRQHETVRAMIRFSGDAEGAMGQYGCKAITQIGNIYVADIPVSQLKAMVNDERVQRIENHMGGKLLMDVTPKWINTPAIYEDTRLPQAYTGKGVLLGIIDVGLEVTHPNFYHADGTQLRVTRFLDQYANANEAYGQPIELGREYTTEADINATTDHCVSLPGCLPSVITVGALNTRPEYINIKGDTITKWGGKSPEGTIAFFSSQGPTLDRLSPTRQQCLRHLPRTSQQS